MTTDTTIVSYPIAGMSCIGCTKKISAALQNVPGVVSATVTLNPPEARLEMTGYLPAGLLNEALMHTGPYRLTEAEDRDPSEAAYAEESRLKGIYDLNLEWIRVQEANAGADGPTIFAAVQKLGLKLEKRKEPVEVFVVDRCERQPTEN